MSKLRRLRQLWRQVPQIECKQLCWDGCGPISASTLEMALMEQESGQPLRVREHPLYPDGTRMCCHLTPEGRCGVYESRPMICRLWGVTEGLPCHHGCKPARYMTDNEGLALLALSLKVGGDPWGMPGDAHDLMIELLSSGQIEVRGSNVPGATTLAWIDHRRRA